LNNNKKNTSKIFSKKSFLYFTGFPKITIVFTLLIFVVIVNAIINIYFIYKDRNNIEKITEFINPYLNDLNRLNKTIVESKMYTTNWVHVPNSVEDKAKLDSLQKFIYPEIKSNLIAKTKVLKDKFPDYKAIENIEFIFKDLDKLIQAQKKVMITLACFDDYENPNKKFKAEDIIESFLFPKTQLILTRLTIITREVEKSTNDLTNQF